MRIPNRKTLAENLVEDIAGRILRGELSTGDRLPPENELCLRYGVSRTVVREAVKMLQARGLVEVTQGAGTVVNADISRLYGNVMQMASQQQQATLRELLEVRRLLEVNIAGLAAVRAAPEDLEQMQTALEMMQPQLGEERGFVDADLAFHRALARAAHNVLLGFLLDSLNGLARYSRQVSFRGPERTSLALQAHQRIHRAVAAGNAPGARKAMNEHLDQTEEDLAPFLDQQLVENDRQANAEKNSVQ